MTSNRDVAVAGMHLAALAIFCRLLSLAKELYVGSVYGADTAFDVYALALLIPSLGIAVAAQGARRGYLAWYSRFARQGESSLHRFEFHFLKILLIGSVCATVLFGVLFGLPWSRWLPWELPAIARLSHLSWLAAATLIPMTLVVGLSTLLNARKDFVLPQLTHLFPPIVTIVLVAGLPEYRTAELLIAGLLGGTILQSLVLWWMSRRKSVASGGWTSQIQSEPLLSRDSDDTRRYYSGFKFVLITMIVLELLVQGNVSVDRLMSSSLDAGQTTLLYWSALMKDFVAGTIIASLLTVQFPQLSEQASRDDYAAIKRTCTLTLRFGALFIFPCTVMLMVGVERILPLLRLGRLDHAAMSVIAPCFSAYAIGFFADLASTSLSQGLMALGRLRTLLLIGIFGYFIPNLIFNSLLIGRFGVVGLAASTSLVGYCTLLCNLVALRFIVGPFDHERQTWGIIGIALGAAGMMWLVVQECLTRLHPHLSENLWTDSLLVGFTLLIGLTIYLAVVIISPARNDLRALHAVLREKLFRVRS